MSVIAANHKIDLGGVVVSLLTTMQSVCGYVKEVTYVHGSTSITVLSSSCYLTRLIVTRESKRVDNHRVSYFLIDIGLLYHRFCNMSRG